MDTQREGWIGDEYVRIYAASQRPRVAALYGWAEFLPAYQLFGSWGLDALCFSTDSRLYLIPWIPLAEAHRKERYSSLDAFESDIASLHEATPAYEHFGKELHFIKPIVFGGDPNDSTNLVMVDQSTHAEVCQYWNRVYLRLRTTGA